jgi:hypothetical protein
MATLSVTRPLLSLSHDCLEYRAVPLLQAYSVKSLLDFLEQSVAGVFGVPVKM